MTHKDTINNEYFEWMYDLVCDGRFAKSISYRKLLMRLHATEFRYSILNDGNRADDGVNLRYRFSRHSGIKNAQAYIDGPCSVLEMILALAIRCEECIMDNPKLGNRTGQWFWGMVNNMGLGAMTDDRFDRGRVDSVINAFLDRRYNPNGKGGLFTIRNNTDDLRNVEIWYQMCWYLDSIT